jgi:hypothetical protein
MSIRCYCGIPFINKSRLNRHHTTCEKFKKYKQNMHNQSIIINNDNTNVNTNNSLKNVNSPPQSPTISSFITPPVRISNNQNYYLNTQINSSNTNPILN